MQYAFIVRKGNKIRKVMMIYFSWEQALNKI